MNDSVNTPDKVTDYLKKNSIKSVIMRPGEKQILNELQQDENSLEFWQNEYRLDVKNKKIDYYEKTRSFEDLLSDFDYYQKKIFSKNSKTLIYLLNKIKILNIFQDLNVSLIDHKQNYKYSIMNGLKKTKDTNYDILIHSESLSFIFKNEFGYDTLTVNGCFECGPKNFSKISKTLAIGSLNAMELKLNLGIVFKLNIILLFLKKIIVFLRKLK